MASSEIHAPRGPLPVERLVLYFGAFAIVLFWIFDLAPRTRVNFYLKQIMMACDNYAFGLLVAALLIIIGQYFKAWPITLLPSQNGPSQNGPSQNGPSQNGPSQNGPSQNGPSQNKRNAILEPLRNGWLRFLELFLTRRSVLFDLRLILAMLLTLAIFSHLKHVIPLVNSAVFDQPLVDSERWLLGGSLATQHVIKILGAGAAPFMSWGYTAYYIYMNAIFMIFILQRDRRLGMEFCTAFALLWFVGALMVYAAPTWGPCFYLPELFKMLPTTPVSELQANLWLQRLHLLANPRSAEGVFLISGQPSLHIAVTVLGSLYLWRLWRPLAVLSWCFVVLTALTTLYLGWHYIADNVLALVLVAVAVWMARRMVATGTPWYVLASHEPETSAKPP